MDTESLYDATSGIWQLPASKHVQPCQPEMDVEQEIEKRVHERFCELQNRQLSNLLAILPIKTGDAKVTDVLEIPLIGMLELAGTHMTPSVRQYVANVISSSCSVSKTAASCSGRILETLQAYDRIHHTSTAAQLQHMGVRLQK